MTCQDRIRELVLLQLLCTYSLVHKNMKDTFAFFLSFSLHTDFFFLAGCRTVKEEVIPSSVLGSEEAEGAGGDGEGY